MSELRYEKQCKKLTEIVCNLFREELNNGELSYVKKEDIDPLMNIIRAYYGIYNAEFGGGSTNATINSALTFEIGGILEEYYYAKIDRDKFYDKKYLERDQSWHNKYKKEFQSVVRNINVSFFDKIPDLVNKTIVQNPIYQFAYLGNSTLIYGADIDGIAYRFTIIDTRGNILDIPKVEKYEKGKWIEVFDFDPSRIPGIKPQATISPEVVLKNGEKPVIDPVVAAGSLANQYGSDVLGYVGKDDSTKETKKMQEEKKLHDN